jgi:NhaA family Na+:H+ antiporter
VPVELRIFLTAATIVDDIGAIIVVAFFYSEAIQPTYLILAAAILGVLILMNRTGVYRVTLYLLIGMVLWALLFAGGLHATLAGVLLALVIPTRDPPNYTALASQADAILLSESQRSDEVLRRGPSEAAMNALDRIHDRLESPADRLLRNVSMRSNYVVLPVFALANAGVVLNMDVLQGHGQLILAVILGLVLGKPLGMLALSALAVRLGIASKSDAYSWGQLVGSGALSGIGFTMSLFIASEAFPLASDFAATKIAVFVASGLAAAIGSYLLWQTGREREAPATKREESPESCTLVDDGIAEPA